MGLRYRRLINSITIKLLFYLMIAGKFKLVAYFGLSIYLAGIELSCWFTSRKCKFS